MTQHNRNTYKVSMDTEISNNNKVERRSKFNINTKANRVTKIKP